ncbi:MAG: hypothetical protein H0T79_12025 [Deltaproteobacteria bacterium]|nr:hypothetical protein [Deltaproteobacteria bacterium]
MLAAHPLTVLVISLLGMTIAEARPPRTRAEYAKAFATIKPGMTGALVKQRLGAPDDIKTARDPGGIAAARTTEVWRWGTRAHLAFGTLGTVHIQADGKVQYVFGGTGTPPAAQDEAELRRLLDVIDAVPSYNATLEPRRLIHAVNALQPLGKARALAILEEYLRVSSSLDDPGREGVFLVLRTLFDVPVSGAMPPMMVGAPTLTAPKDPTLLPRFPLVLVDDVPLTLVRGYTLGGQPERPEAHVAWFRTHGTLRAKPLAPPARSLDAISAYVDGPLAKLVTVDDDRRVLLYDQAVRLIGTAYRPATVDQGWFPHSVAQGPSIAARPSASPRARSSSDPSRRG